MWKKWLGCLFAALLLFVDYPVHAASVTADMLLQEAQKTSGMLEHDAPLEQIMVQADAMGRMLTKYDFSKSDITLEGLQSLTSEMVGLKLRLTSVQAPDRQEIKRQADRLVVAFDSLANPKTANWKQTAREMNRLAEKMLAAAAQNNRAEFQNNLQSLLARHSRIQIAMELNLLPEQMNLLNSAARFLQQQREPVSDPAGMKEVVQQYKHTLDEIEQKPPAAAIGIKKQASSYNAQSWWIAAALLACSGYLIYRRMAAR